MREAVSLISLNDGDVQKLKQAGLGVPLMLRCESFMWVPPAQRRSAGSPFLRFSGRETLPFSLSDELRAMAQMIRKARLTASLSPVSNPVSFLGALKHPRRSGAGDGNRTHVNSLEGCRTTIVLHPLLNLFAW
jgi:hypothetical protein